MPRNKKTKGKNANKGWGNYAWLLPPRVDEEKLKARDTFDREALGRICAMHEQDFADAYEMLRVNVEHRQAPDDFYLFRDNGSKVLAVAHLDTVGLHHERMARFVDTEAGPVVFSRALDDRLGAYTILEWLPALGIQYDLLLTVGEEQGRSTAEFFEPPKDYDWMIEFDRGGTDVVMYQYEDNELADRVEESGAHVGRGIFSDICYLEHLGIKGINWGIGYRDYHGPRAHAFLDDTFKMVGQYLRFHEKNAGTAMPHEYDPPWYLNYRDGRGDPWDDGWDEDEGIIDVVVDEDKGEKDFIEYPTLDELRDAL